MDCTFDREQLALYVNDDLTEVDRRAVEEHLAACAACERVLAGYRRDTVAVAEFVVSTPQGTRPLRAQPRLRRPVLATAALMMVVLLLLQAPALAGIVEWVRVRMLAQEETAQVLRDLHQERERPPIRLTTADQVEGLVGAPLLRPAYLPPGYESAPDLNVTEPGPRVNQFFVWTGPRSAGGYSDGIWIRQGPQLTKEIEWSLLQGMTHRTIPLGGEQALLVTGRVDHEKGAWSYKPERGYSLAFHWGNQFVVVSTYQGRTDMDRALPLEELVKVAESLPR